MVRLPTPKEMLAALVATPSVSSTDPRFDQSNRAVVDRLASYCEDLGFRVEVKPIADAPHKANLVAVLGEGEGGLVLSGHTDTVPFDASGWTSDPFVLTDRDGALHGLGACDMKAFFPAALHAIASLDRAKLRAPIVFVATADEESGMDGVRQLVAEGSLAGAHAVIGEPTGLRPIRQHKGVMQTRIALEGRAGHASDPSLGISALDGMAEVLPALLALRAELAREHRDDRFRVPSPTLNLGRIAAGDSANRICGHAELDVDLRLLPGMDPEAVRARLSSCVASALTDARLRVAVSALSPGVPPFETPEDAAIVKAAAELTGEPAGSVLFATEGPFFNALGKQTIVLGPGSIDVAHQANEYVRVEDLERARELYARLAHRFCVEDV